MNIQQKEFIRFIKLLADNDCLEYVILIGSWAEFLYRELGILQKFEPNIKTLDIDFLLKNLRRPIPEKNIIPLAKAAGYLIESDRLYGTTKIYDKNGLEIEFLINQLGAGSESTLKTNLGVAGPGELLQVFHRAVCCLLRIYDFHPKTGSLCHSQNGHQS